MIYKSYLLLSVLSITPVAWAMESLDDSVLAATVGQDGLTIGINMKDVKFNQMAIIDNNGIADLQSTYGNRAGFVIAGANSATPVSLKFEGGSATVPALQMLIDTTGGNGAGAFARLGLSFGNNITGLTLSPFNVYFASSGSLSTDINTKSIYNGTSLVSGVKPFIKVGEVNIKFANGNSPTANIQLGHSPQGQLLRFGGAIDSICGADDGCNIQVADGNTGIGFDFQLTGHQANPATPTGTAPARQMFSLDGFYTAVKSEGLEFGNVGTSSKFDTNLNNLTLGTNGQVSTAGSFVGIPNGAIGNIGLNGVSVTNMKMKVSGF